jgi:uncharacterized protein YceK
MRRGSFTVWVDDSGRTTLSIDRPSDDSAREDEQSLTLDWPRDTKWCLRRLALPLAVVGDTTPTAWLLIQAANDGAAYGGSNPPPPTTTTTQLPRNQPNQPTRAGSAGEIAANFFYEHLEVSRRCSLLHGCEIFDRQLGLEDVEIWLGDHPVRRGHTRMVE